MSKEILAHRDGWRAVAEIERQELQNSSLVERWRQLNAVIGLALGLGLMISDQSEEEVHLRWAKLKNQSSNLGPRI